jgi:hypothetical protein
MTYGVYQKLSTFEGERNKKIVSKKIFSNGYAITCTGIDGKSHLLQILCNKP